MDSTVSLITERRVSQPWGLAGGEPGALGESWLLPGGDESRAERLPDRVHDPVEGRQRPPHADARRRRVGQAARGLTRSNGGSRGPDAYPGAVVRQAAAARNDRQEVQRAASEAAGPTADDVPITSDGQRLDSKEKALAFCADLAAGSGVALDLDAAAVLLGMTPAHLGRLCEQGRVECVSMEGSRLVPAA